MAWWDFLLNGLKYGTHPSQHPGGSRPGVQPIYGNGHVIGGDRTNNLSGDISGIGGQPWAGGPTGMTAPPGYTGTSGAARPPVAAQTGTTSGGGQNPYLQYGTLAGLGVLNYFGNRANSQAAQEAANPPEFNPLRDLLIRQAESNLRNPTSLPAGYEAQGISNINATNDVIGGSIRNDLISRGLTDSPVGAAVSGNQELARGGQIAAFRNQLPLLERNLRNEDTDRALQIYGSRSGAYAPNPIGSTAGDMAELLAYYYGRGQLPGQTPRPSP